MKEQAIEVRQWVLKRMGGMSRTKVIALGFALIILTGALLLMLPISSREGIVTNFWDCLFTATSATCVTGLVVVDTYQHWTIFGQIVIILLIQIGGLGFVTFLTIFSMIAHRKIGLKERSLMSESVNAMQLGGIIKLTRKILYGTLIVEGTGATILWIRFIPDFGVIRGLYYGIFHAISAFCNAGFDLMGYADPYISLCNYSGDWVVNLTIMSLIVIGGIGFIVWDDVTHHRLHFRKYRVHTKIVLVTTAALIFGGALIFYLIERNYLLDGMGPGEAFLCSMFASITPRTAGFNSTDIATAREASKFLFIILMFIGGSPGSTAGGIKTTTFALFVLYMKANFQRAKGVHAFRRRLDEEAIKKASAIVCTNTFLVVTASMIICGTQGFDLADVVLETVSAMSTVGMSSGITRGLSILSKVSLVCLMYAGRVGSLSVVLSVRDKKKVEPYTYPEEKLLIG